MDFVILAKWTVFSFGWCSLCKGEHICEHTSLNCLYIYRCAWNKCKGCTFISNLRLIYLLRPLRECMKPKFQKIFIFTFAYPSLHLILACINNTPWTSREMELLEVSLSSPSSPNKHTHTQKVIVVHGQGGFHWCLLSHSLNISSYL